MSINTCLNGLFMFLPILSSQLLYNRGTSCLVKNSLNFSQRIYLVFDLQSPNVFGNTTELHQLLCVQAVSQLANQDF